VREPRPGRRTRRRADHLRTRRCVPEGPADRRRGERRGREPTAAARSERRPRGGLQPTRAGVRDAAAQPDDGPALRDRRRRSARRDREGQAHAVKPVIAIFALVFGIPVLQGAIAPSLPPAFRPDLALLAVLSLSLAWRNTATGLVLAAICGFFVDL